MRRLVASLVVASLALLGARCSQSAVLFPRMADGYAEVGEVESNGAFTGVLVPEGTCLLVPTTVAMSLRWCMNRVTGRDCSPTTVVGGKDRARECERLRFASIDSFGAWTVRIDPDLENLFSPEIP